MNQNVGSLPSTFDDGEMYDLFCGELDYGVQFYLGLARQTAGPVLELACGTGRILLPCAQAGVDIEGVDLFEPMLARLRRKAELIGLTPRLHYADMCAFQLERKFGAIIIPFNAFGHNLTTETQVQCLRRCHDHLLPGGTLVLDTFFPGLSVIGKPDNLRELELETKHPVSGRTLRFYDTRCFDRVAQIQQSVNEMEELDAQGHAVVVHRSAIRIRWIYPPEMELLLRVAGFARWAIYGGFDRRPLTQETDAMIVQAWRA